MEEEHGCARARCQYMLEMFLCWVPCPPSSFLTKIRQLKLPQVADEQVLGLQVPVENLPAMDVAQSPEQLEQKDLEG